MSKYLLLTQLSGETKHTRPVLVNMSAVQFIAPIEGIEGANCIVSYSLGSDQYIYLTETITDIALRLGVDVMFE